LDEPVPSVPGALPAAAALTLTGLALILGDPRPPGGLPVELRLVDEAGAPVVGEVSARCWHAHLTPPWTERRGPTDAAGTFLLDAPACPLLQVAAVAPGRRPLVRRTGHPAEPLVLGMLPLPAAAPVEVRELGWQGRPVPGVTLTMDRGAEPRVVGWDLLGDRAVERREEADLWLESNMKGSLPRPVAGPGAWVSALPEDHPQPALWHATALQRGEARLVPASPEAIWLVARDGRTAALLLPDPARSWEPCEPEGCERATWTFAAIVDPTGEGRFDLGLGGQLDALLPTPSPAALPTRTPLQAMVTP
jgi:hypothetical protein